jgi:hypothetical protein
MESVIDTYRESLYCTPRRYLVLFFVPSQLSPFHSFTCIETGLDQRICILYAGIVSYDIVLQNGTVQLQFDDYSKDEFVHDL